MLGIGINFIFGYGGPCLWQPLAMVDWNLTKIWTSAPSEFRLVISHHFWLGLGLELLKTTTTFV